MGFNLADYQPVEDRLRQFWEECETGRVSTDLVSHSDTQYIVKADVWRDINDPAPAATGYAHEVSSQRGVNSTSALENCETSAIGRALANLGYAPKGKRPSREEMAKARPEPTTDPDWLRDAAIGITEAKTSDDLATVATFIKDGVNDGKCSDDSRADLLVKWKQKEQELTNDNA